MFQPAYSLDAFYWGQTGNIHAESKRSSYSGGGLLHGQAVVISFSSIWSLSTPTNPLTRWYSSSVEISQRDGIWRFCSFLLFFAFISSWLYNNILWHIYFLTFLCFLCLYVLHFIRQQNDPAIYLVFYLAFYYHVHSMVCHKSSEKIWTDPRMDSLLYILDYGQT